MTILKLERMKKYYCITIIAIIIITLLQGYNIFLEYNNYISKTMEEINSSLIVSIDEEYAIRAHKKHQEHLDGKQRLYYKIMSDEDFKRAKPNPKDVIRLDEINISDLRRKGIAETEADVLGLLGKDLMANEGKPLMLKILSKLFKKNVMEDFPYTLFILDENKKTIKSYGQTEGTENWQSSKPIAIGLKPVRFIQVRVGIQPSAFIKNSIVTLGLTSLLALLIILCVGYQMTVIRRKEETLRKREMSIHGTIHDMKAPLASILMTLSFIKGQIKDSELYALINKSEKQIRYLSNTIKTILIAAKAGENKLRLNKEYIDIMELTSQAKELVITNYEDKRPMVNIIDSRTTKDKICADKFLITNAIYNLMENAVKYSASNSHIEATIADNHSFVFISIKDDGIGIEKKYQKKIFEQFYRVPDTPYKSGYGIGLAMVWYTAKAHGGKIKVESEPGKGSTFTLILPTT